jgi:diguanylate cyclase (GGDEF)-like protein
MSQLDRRSGSRDRRAPVAEDHAQSAPVKAEISTGTSREVARALRRMRLIMATLLVVQFATYRPGTGDAALPIPPTVMGVGLAAVALAISGVSLLGERRPRWRRPLELAELIADSVLVIALATAFDVTGRDVLWVLLVIPVLEGALRYRLRGAMLVWALIGAAYLAVTMVTSGAVGDDRLVEMEQAVEHLGVVLLITVPAGFLSEQLLIDIGAQREAWRHAVHRGNMLEAVAEAGHRISSLEIEAVAAVTRAALDLGFDRVDLGVAENDAWRSVGRQPGEGIPLPPPGAAGGAAQLALDQGRAVVVEADSEDRGERAALERAGLAAMVVCPVTGLGAEVVLRAGVERGAAASDAQYDCLDLIASQAGVAMRNSGLVARQRALQEQLEHHAFHDGMTGLPNRVRFLQLLEQALDGATQTSGSIAVLFVDLDRFKPVNDSLGHDAGNELLIAVAGRLNRAVRTTDLVGRLGGDEFVVLVDPIEGAAEATEVAERCSEALEGPFAVADHEVVIGASIGVAVASPPFDNAAELIRRADQAMYGAKGSRAEAWCLYEPGIDMGSLARLELEGDLRRALNDAALRLVYQPIVNAEEGALAGVEALVRWTHPDNGPIPPPTIISVAEDSGLIAQVSRRVLEQACSDHRRWREAVGDAAPWVAVNVAPRHLETSQFLADLDRTLDGAGMTPFDLVLEVTENLVALGDDLSGLLDQVRSRGIRLALDDFGQGQTSLRHLRDLPLDMLKIDRGFVEGLADHAADRVIVRSVIALAHELAMQVTAEGIETSEQLGIVREAGADLLQGFLIREPVDATTILAMLQAPRPVDFEPVATAPDPAAPSEPAAVPPVPVATPTSVVGS